MFLIILFLGFAVTFLVARNIFFATLVFGDRPLVRLSSATILKEYVFNIWHRAAFGESYPSPQGYIFLYLFNQAASYFNDIGLFNLLMNLSFPLSFLTFYLLSKRFCENIWLQLFGATLYLINPVVITYYNFGGFMLCLVFLPLALLFFIDLLEEPTTKNLARATTFISLTMWTFPTLSIIFLSVLFTIAICYLMLSPSKSKFLKSVIPKFFVLILLVIICNAPYFFAQHIYSNSPLYGYEQFDILLDFKFTYRELNLSNFLRLAGNIGSPQVPLGYNDPLNINNEIGLILPLLAFISIFFTKNSQEKKVRIVALLITAFVLAIFTLVLRTIMYSDLSWILRSIPFLWTLRNPFKLQLMFAICIISLFIFSTERIAILFVLFLKKRDLRFTILTFTIIFLALSHVFIYNSSVLSGYMGLDKTYGDLRNLLPDQTLISIVEDSLNWCDEENYRGIILPFDHKTELYVEFVNPLLYPGRLGHHSKVIDVLNNELKTGSDLINLLRLLSIRYVYTNNKWRDTGFQILQPRNLAEIVENFGKKGILYENQSGYSKFIIEPTLPRLYLSNYPIFYSNIETIELINSSIFYFKPVFFEIKYNGCEIDAFDMPVPMIFCSYYMEIPIQGVFDVYAVIYTDKQETTIFYSLDEKGFVNKTIFKSQDPLKYLAKFELKEGVHKLLLATNEREFFMNMDKEFYGEGSYNIGSLLKIENGVLSTLKVYDNFDLNLDFKPVEFGEKSWNGPTIYLAWTNSSYLRLIFHKENCLEIAELTTEGVYHEGVVVKRAEVTPGSWNNLRVIKNNQTLVLYLNGKYLLSFTSPLLKCKGRIGIGSDNSVTYFKDVSISKDIILAVWLFPTESPKDIPITFIQMNPEKYLLQFNQTYNSFVILCLGESYDPFWEAKIDGTVLKTHLNGNVYANSWIIYKTDGCHTIEICYKPNILYRHLLYLDLVTICILVVTSYFPTSILHKLCPLKRKIVIKRR